MTESEVLTAIADEARRHLAWEGDLDLDLRLVEDLELDSIKLLTLAVAVENRFQVRLDPDRDHELVTVRNLVDAIQRQLA